jgi:heme O synthase-like polyprenyltransferase
MDALHRKRALAVGIVRHWAQLVAFSLFGSAWCASQPAQAALFLPAVLSVAAAQAGGGVLLDHPRVRQDVQLRRERQAALQPGRVHHGGARSVPSLQEPQAH